MFHESDVLKITIYYKSHTINNLISQNNLSHKSNPLKQTNNVYKYTCNVGDSELQNSTYIGMTTTTLSSNNASCCWGSQNLHAKIITTLSSAEKIVSKTPIFYTMNQISTGSKSWKPS